MLVQYYYYGSGIGAALTVGNYYVIFYNKTKSTELELECYIQVEAYIILFIYS